MAYHGWSYGRRSSSSGLESRIQFIALVMISEDDPRATQNEHEIGFRGEFVIGTVKNANQSCKVLHNGLRLASTVEESISCAQVSHM